MGGTSAFISFSFFLLCVPCGEFEYAEMVSVDYTYQYKKEFAMSCKSSSSMVGRRWCCVLSYPTLMLILSCPADTILPRLQNGLPRWNNDLMCSTRLRLKIFGRAISLFGQASIYMLVEI
jgi:hypothetical protein